MSASRANRSDCQFSSQAMGISHSLVQSRPQGSWSVREVKLLLRLVPVRRGFYYPPTLRTEKPWFAIVHLLLSPWHHRVTSPPALQKTPPDHLELRHCICVFPHGHPYAVETSTCLCSWDEVEKEENAKEEDESNTLWRPYTTVSSNETPELEDTYSFKSAPAGWKC